MEIKIKNNNIKEIAADIVSYMTGLKKREIYENYAFDNDISIANEIYKRNYYYKRFPLQQLRLKPLIDDVVKQIKEYHKNLLKIDNDRLISFKKIIWEQKYGNKSFNRMRNKMRNSMRNKYGKLLRKEICERYHKNKFVVLEDVVDCKTDINYIFRIFMKKYKYQSNLMMGVDFIIYLYENYDEKMMLILIFQCVWEEVFSVKAGIVQKIGKKK